MATAEIAVLSDDDRYWIARYRSLARVKRSWLVDTTDQRMKRILAQMSPAARAIAERQP